VTPTSGGQRKHNRGKRNKSSKNTMQRKKQSRRSQPKSSCPWGTWAIAKKGGELRRQTTRRRRRRTGERLAGTQTHETACRSLLNTVKKERKLVRRELVPRGENSAREKPEDKRKKVVQHRQKVEKNERNAVTKGAPKRLASVFG